jgi:hypothetical protein
VCSPAHLNGVSSSSGNQTGVQQVRSPKPVDCRDNEISNLNSHVVNVKCRYRILTSGDEGSSISDEVDIRVGDTENVQKKSEMLSVLSDITPDSDQQREGEEKG